MYRWREVGYNGAMHVLALSIILWVVGADTSAAGLPGPPRCDPLQCGRPPDPNLLDQYEQIATCMTGPGQWVAPSCACADLDGDAHVTLRDFAALQIVPVFVCERGLAFAQRPGMGFCPSPGTVHSANVIPALDGTVVLVGARILEGDPERNQCLPYVIWPSECLIDVYFPPRTLSLDEQNELSALLTAIPEDPCCDDWAVDPCVILYLRYQGQEHRTYCYGCDKSEAYRRAISDVADYLAELLTQPS